MSRREDIRRRGRRSYRKSEERRVDPADALLEKHEELMEKAEELKVLAEDFIDSLEDWYDEEMA